MCKLGSFTDLASSYYLSDILDMVGIKDAVVKSKINIGIACWSLLNATTIALLSPRFRRRPTYITCVCSLLCVYISWTICTERYMSTESQGAGIGSIVFMFLYSPCYNIGYNALTYSTSFLLH